MKLFLASLFLLAAACFAGWGPVDTETHTAQIAVYLPPAICQFVPCVPNQRTGAMVFAIRAKSGSTPEAYRITLEYEQDGKRFSREQITTQDFAVFLIGEVQPLSVSIQNIEWASVELHSTQGYK